MRYRFLLGCLILSGYAGLAYELLWVRLLALSFGSTAASFSTVLAVFFGGLAIGSLVGGRVAKRVTRPVQAYARLELGTGAAALLLYPALVSLESTFGYFDPGPGTAGTLVRLVVAGLLLLTPTILMGATLPFVTRAMVERDEDIGRATALIYAFNTLGACAGAYFTTFWTLPYMGIFASTLLAVGINLAVFALSTWLGRDERPPISEPPARERSPTISEREDDKLKLVGSGLALILGFAAVALQVVWVRIFATAMEGTVYGTGSVLIAVLVGIGIGSLGLAPFLKRSPRTGLAFVGLQAAGLLLVLLQLKLLPWITYELGALQVQRLGHYGLHLQMLVVILAVLGPAICSGASLPLIIGIVEDRAADSARSVGNVYAANTMGAIAGSLLTGFVVLPTAGSEAAVMLAVMSLAGAAAFGALFLVQAERPVRLGLVAGGLALAALYQGYDIQALTTGPTRGSFTDWWNRSTRQKQATLLFSEAPSANVRVLQSAGARSLTLNGLGQGGRAESPPHHIRESLLMAAIPLSHARGKDNALLVGLGAGITVDAMLELDVGHIRVVELEPKVVDAVQVIFADDTPLASDRVEVIINDARHYLNTQRNRNGDRYDIIASMPAHPWVASPIFTQEFFEIVKENLKEDGIFCSWFGLIKMDSAATDSLLRAFTSVFDHYVIYFIPAHGAYYLVGSPQPIEISPQRYDAVFSTPVVRAHQALRAPMFLPRRVVASGRGAEGTQVKSGPMNTDDRPIVEMLSPTTTPTTGTASQDLFSHRGVDPEMVPQSERATFVEDLLEELLGTPKGELPRRPRGVNVKGAQAVFERASDALSPAAAEYFALRIEIGKRPRDLSLRERIEALDPAFRARARKAYAWSLPPYSEARREALESLPAETDVIIHLLFEIGTDALSRVPPEAPATEVSEVDHLAWWLWKLQHDRQLSAEDLRRLTVDVGPLLAATGNDALLTASAELAREQNALQLAQTADNWAQTARTARARYHRQAGLAAGKSGRFQEAADHLWRAFATAPLDPALRMPLVQSLVEVDDSDRLEETLNVLRFQGLTEGQVAFLEAEARRRRAAGKGFQTPDESVSEPAAPAPPPSRSAMPLGAGTPQLGSDL